MIYVAQQYHYYLGVINAPDSAGTACNFVQNGFSLDTNTCSIGLPNFVHYMITITNVETPTPQPGFSIYPNPAGEEFVIQSSKFKVERIEIFNRLGEMVFSKQPQTSNIKLQMQTFQSAS